MSQNKKHSKFRTYFNYLNVLFVFFLAGNVNAQYNLDYYLIRGVQNSPTLNDITNLQTINSLQNRLNNAENSAFNIYLSADYLFAPYFNNNGKFISANPLPKAIGYDAGISNGGLYSAQLNVEKNIFNRRLVETLEHQNQIQGSKYKLNYELEKRSLQKQITDQFITSHKSISLYNLSKEVTDNLTKQLRVLEVNVKSGYADAQSYLLLKIELQNQKTNSVSLYNQYRNDLYQLNAICGIRDTSVVALNPSELIASVSNEQSGFLKSYSLDSISIAMEQSVFETKYLPQLKLFVNTGLNAVEIEGIQKKFGLSAGLNFILPLYDGEQKDITREQNTIAQKTIGEYRKYSKLNIELQKENSSGRIKSLKQTIDNLNEQSEEYSKIISISEKQVQNGNISMIDYLTLLKNYLEFKNTLIETNANYQMEINNYNYWNW